MTDNKERMALQKLLDRYVSLVESGDAGHWDAEKEPAVIEARAALAASQDETARLSIGVNGERLERSIKQLAASQEKAEPGRTPYLPYLSDRADGVSGHYAIARWNPHGYREVWNLRRHCWASASDEVLTLPDAVALLRGLMISTAPVAAQADMRECRHCGWMCAPNDAKSKRWYPLAEPVALEAELIVALRWAIYEAHAQKVAGIAGPLSRILAQYGAKQ